MNNSPELDSLFSAPGLKGNVPAQAEQLEVLKERLDKVLNSPPDYTNISKDILGGVFTNAPGGGQGGTPFNTRPYDLEPIQFITPADTPLRNSIPRTKGAGGAAEYRQIIGVSNSTYKGAGPGVADININTNAETVSTTFGGLAGLRRGPIIQYAGRQVWVPYTEQSVSDTISYRANFSAIGFTNPRHISTLALMRSHMRGEEMTMLLGAGPTAAGFSGPSSATSTTA